MALKSEWFRRLLIKWGILQPWRAERLIGAKCGCIVRYVPENDNFVVEIGCGKHWPTEIWNWDDVE